MCRTRVFAVNKTFPKVSKKNFARNFVGENFNLRNRFFAFFPTNGMSKIQKKISWNFRGKIFSFRFPALLALELNKCDEVQTNNSWDHTQLRARGFNGLVLSQRTVTFDHNLTVQKKVLKDNRLNDNLKDNKLNDN